MSLVKSIWLLRMPAGMEGLAGCVWMLQGTFPCQH